MALPRTFCWLGLSLLCLGFASGCKGKREEASSRKPPLTDEPFQREPKFTPEVHYLAGQVHESKLAAAGPNGKPLPPSEAAQLQAAALNQYAAALKLDPRHAPSLYRSAVVFNSMKRYDQSIQMWQRYVEAVGRTPDSLVNLGIACEFARRSPEAEAAYREAVQRDPAHKTAHVNLGLLLARRGQVQDAQAALAAVLEPAAVHWHLGVGLSAAGRSPEAEQQFRAAAALDPAYAKRPPAPGSSARAD